jgi:hypothetical protein
MLHRNPIFIRFCRSELRFRKAIFWYLLTLIATAFTVAVVYGPQIAQGRDSVEAARQALLPIMIIQGIILLFMGTGTVASGITREKVDDVLNYQRLTPLPVRDKILGYLFGLPIRHYVMFAITLPFLAFVLIVGRIPSSAFVPYYLVFLSSTLLYHLTGMVAGMISKRWRWSAKISQILIILLYFVLPQLSHIGLVFLEFLTVRPVFLEYIMPIIGVPENVHVSGAGILQGQSVPFFTLQLSGTLFSFLIQSGLVILFTGIVARKWKANSVPAVSKSMAMATLIIFAIMSLANIWPNLTRSGNALDIFQSNGNLGAELAVTALPLILALTTTVLAFVLMTTALPDPMEYRHGRIRADRLGLSRLAAWEDAATGYLFTGLAFLVQVVLLSVTFLVLHRAGYYGEANASPFDGLWIILACGLSLFYFQGLKENFGVAQLAMSALLGWALPLLGAILIMAIGQDEQLIGTTLMVAALSPITIIPFSATQMIPADLMDSHAMDVQRAFGTAVIVLTGLNLWLHWRLRRIRSRRA